MNYFFISLGCAKNLYDSEQLSRHLSTAGYTQTAEIANADLIIINTCGFIKDAKEESIETILTALQDKRSDADIVVYGCLVQRYQDTLKKLIPEVRLFLPILSYEKLAHEIQKRFPPREHAASRPGSRIFFTPPAYTYIKIAEGCRNYCSYCAIPLIRGPLKSLPVRSIVEQSRLALGRGHYELNLIAQDITSYGTDLRGKTSLEVLLKNLLGIKKEFWLRLLYLYPSRITDRLIDIINSDERIVKYLDIPVQHVSSRILKLMNRQYDKRTIQNTIAKLRRRIPGLALRTSIITGFPTETADDFAELAEFIEETRFDHLGVFEYSPEEDTRAANLTPPVPSGVARKRKQTLMAIQKRIATEKNKAYKKKTLPCLIEQPVDEYGAVWTGRIYSQAPEVDGVVYVTGYSPFMGQLVPVAISASKGYDLTANVRE